MANAYSLEDLLDFLDHASDRGLMPAATAQALAVASRNVLGVLTEEEKSDLSKLDIVAVVRRFTNKRARDFNPASLKEYGRRVHRAIGLYLDWRTDPASFKVKTRSTAPVKKKEKTPQGAEESDLTVQARMAAPNITPGAYQSSVPVRPGIVVTLVNLPQDLTKAEADRIAAFVKMLAVDG